MRSAIADDRRRGAEAGKRPALRARALFSAVTVVPRVCAPPCRQLRGRLWRCRGASQPTRSDLYVLISISFALARFPLGEKTSRGTREACPPASTSSLSAALLETRVEAETRPPRFRHPRGVAQANSPRGEKCQFVDSDGLLVKTFRLWEVLPPVCDPERRESESSVALVCSRTVDCPSRRPNFPSVAALLGMLSFPSLSSMLSASSAQ